MSMCSLFLVVAMRDSHKHNTILHSTAKLIFALMHVVTCDFSIPPLIDSNEASLE